MNSATATTNLADAWKQRFYRATATLSLAEQAPALFRPEYVEELRAEAEQSWHWYTFWLDQEDAR